MPVDNDDVVDFGGGAVEPPARSIRDLIRESIASRQRRSVELTHPDVPEWTVTYRVPTSRSEVSKLFERTDAKAKRAKEPTEFDAALLALCCEQIHYNGILVTDEDTGTALTFRDKEFWDMVDATSNVDAVRKTYGSDGYVTAVHQRLLEAAGYGTDGDMIVEDPTGP